MIKETYIKEVDKDSETVVISFEGDKEDIYRIRDYAEHMHDEPIACEENTNEQSTEMVLHPNHYNMSSIECIDEMILLYGVTATKHFCELNIHKYRSRANHKGGEEDMKKADFYMREYAWLCSKQEEEIIEEIVERYKHLMP